jgi:hypothetical protein
MAASAKSSGTQAKSMQAGKRILHPAIVRSRIRTCSRQIARERPHVPAPVKERKNPAADFISDCDAIMALMQWEAGVPYFIIGIRQIKYPGE